MKPSDLPTPSNPRRGSASSTTATPTEAGIATSESPKRVTRRNRGVSAFQSSRLRTSHAWTVRSMLFGSSRRAAWLISPKRYPSSEEAEDRQRIQARSSGSVRPGTTIGGA